MQYLNIQHDDQIPPQDMKDKNGIVYDKVSTLFMDIII